MANSNNSPSPLRQRMIDDMVMRKLSPKTQTGYIRHVRKFSEHLGRSPQTATSEDLRLYQLYLVEEGMATGNLISTIAGLRFFFNVTLKHPMLYRTSPTLMNHAACPRYLMSRRSLTCSVKRAVRSTLRRCHFLTELVYAVVRW